MFGFFLTYSQSVRAKKEKENEEKERKRGKEKKKGKRKRRNQWVLDGGGETEISSVRSWVCRIALSLIEAVSVVIEGGRRERTNILRCFVGKCRNRTFTGPP